MDHDARFITNLFITRGKKEKNLFKAQQLLKLPYLCQAWMLGMFGKPMFYQEIEAWEHGPVIPDVWESVKNNRKAFKKPIKDIDTTVLDDEEVHIFDQVYKNYHNFSGNQLSTITHSPGTPWYLFMQQDPLAYRKVIPRSLIQECYKKKLDEYREHRNEV